MVKNKLSLLILFSLLSVFFYMPKASSQTSYTIAPNFVNGQKFPSNTKCTFSATIYPTSPSVTVYINTTWGYSSSASTVDGYVEFQIKTPKTSQQIITFSIKGEYPTSVTRTIQVVDAVKFSELKYDSVQHYAPSYDPYPDMDILILGKPIDTDEGIGVELTSLTVTSNNYIGTARYYPSNRTGYSGWYEIVIPTNDVSGVTYQLTLTPSAMLGDTTLYQIKSTITIRVESPILYVKVTVGEQTKFMYEGNVDNTLKSSKGEQNIYISFYNSKLTPLPNVQLISLHVLGGGGGTVYSQVPQKNSAGVYVVPITLVDEYYEIHISAKYGMEYVKLNDFIFTISTFGGFDITSFLFFLIFWGILVGIIVFIIWRRSKASSSRTTSTGGIWD